MRKTIIVLITLLILLGLGIAFLIWYDYSHITRVSDLDNQCLALAKKLGHSITLKECLEIKK